MGKRRNRRVLVLNAGFEPLHHVSPEDAIRMIFAGDVYVLEEDKEDVYHSPPKWIDGELKSEFSIARPTKVVLVKYVQMKWFFKAPVLWSKSGVLRRDNYECAYCGRKATTIDHVIPQVDGGLSTWENTVASCFDCNNAKDSKSLKEMGWTLKFKPGVPRRDQLIANAR